MKQLSLKVVISYIEILSVLLLLPIVSQAQSRPTYVPTPVKEAPTFVDLWTKLSAKESLQLRLKAKKSDPTDAAAAKNVYVRIRDLQDKLSSEDLLIVKPKKTKLLLDAQKLDYSNLEDGFQAIGDLKDFTAKNILGQISFDIKKKLSITILLNDESSFSISRAPGGKKDVYILEELEAVGKKPTPKGTATVVRTNTAAATAVSTAIPTAVRTPTALPTIAPTTAPTVQATNTATSAPPNFTPTATRTATRTFTPSLTATRTYTPTISKTPSFTFTPTATATITATPTALPVNWFTTNMLDTQLKTLGSTLYQDGVIDRNDMISILRKVEEAGSVSANQMTDLTKIANTSALFGTNDHIKKLSGYIILGNAANATYQGVAMGNLAAGSNAVQLEKLLSKWFLGTDHPSAGGPYVYAAGQVFVAGAAYTDMHQGALGDCYLMTAQSALALNENNIILNKLIVNGDGTYTVKLFNGNSTEYITVDSYLPINGNGNLMYGGLGTNPANTNSELWYALIEKAYVQANEMGWIRSGLSGSGINQYSSIDGGYVYKALGDLSGKPTTAFNMTAGSNAFNNFVAAYNAGKAMGFASYATPAISGVVGNHAYAVVGYDPATQKVTLFNPWGINYGLLYLTWPEITSSFQYFDRLF